jgi:hypothetical protein
LASNGIAILLQSMIGSSRSALALKRRAISSGLNRKAIHSDPILLYRFILTHDLIPKVRDIFGVML